MNITAKKIIASILILIGLLPLLFSIYIYIKQQEIRYSMKEKLEIKILLTITLTKNDISWHNAGTELLINGRLFDVKSFHAEANGKISFIGLYDDDETLLVNDLRKSQQNENNNDGKLVAKLFQLLQISFSTSLTEMFVPFIKINHRQDFAQRLVSPFTTIISPPPQA